MLDQAMDATESLEALSDLLTELSSNPYDISLHAQHIRLASATGMQEQVKAAREMMIAFWPAGDHVWLPLLEAETAEGMDSVERVQMIHSLFEQAEADYLSIPLLQKHLEFLLEQHSHSNSSEHSEAYTLDVDWTRDAIASVVEKGIGHLTQSQSLWEVRRDWELEQLEAATGDERERLIAMMENFHVTRFKQPHAAHDGTFQSYSSFTTNYRPPVSYEQLMVSASKVKGAAVKAWSRRESLESALETSGNSPEGYAYYIAMERKAKQPDAFVIQFLYERAIADTAKRRFDGHADAEVALRVFWTGYCDFLRIDHAAPEEQLRILKRAVRDVPGSGEVWARYIRFMERNEKSFADGDSIPKIYGRALATNLLQRDVEQLIPLSLARAGYEKRKIEADSGEGGFDVLVQVLEDAITLVRQVSAQGDPRYRLEKYLADLYLNLAEVPENANSIWQTTAKHYKSSYLAWTSYTDVLIEQGLYDEARVVFRDISSKNLDWPEAVFDAWISFEHLYGSLEDLDDCMDRVERAQRQVDARRAKEAQKIAFQQAQINAEIQAAAPVQDAPVPTSIIESTEMPMDTEAPSLNGSHKKRKADDQESTKESKKAKFDDSTTLKRDRENSTVFIADLVPDTTEDDLKALFKDCGEVREVKLSPFQDSMVATVEFTDRDSVPAALTKDKKRVKGQETSVHLAWQSTLYVTNFPTSMDDAGIRELFGQFGVIFDVRWPSKKFKNSRRFCYIQYILPDSARAALTLHGRELETGLSLQVFISNPERRKERTDANANAKEVYIAGLSKFATKTDLQKLFSSYGTIKDIRINTDDAGHCKGFAFVEFEDEASSERALQANNHDLKNRRIAVTSADSRVRARERKGQNGPERQAEIRSRSVRVKKLPAGTQEGLLQQALEKVVVVKRVEIFQDLGEALVELDSAADAGKLLLLPEPLKLNGVTLEMSEELPEKSSTARPMAPPMTAGGMFVPRSAVSRPRAGLGAARKPKPATASTGVITNLNTTDTGKGKGQDDFRKMLG